MDINEEIRFRVVNETFVDLTPTGPDMSNTETTLEGQETKKSPYTITVSIIQDNIRMQILTY